MIYPHKYTKVSFRGSNWVIEKRFNDFVALQQGLAREFRDKDVGALPKRRFFNRWDQGSTLNMLSSCSNRTRCHGISAAAPFDIHPRSGANLLGIREEILLQYPMIA